MRLKQWEIEGMEVGNGIKRKGKENKELEKEKVCGGKGNGL